MNSPKPTVSVVLCTFNGAAFLRAQLDSIFAQTYPLQEVLAFDDGSTDDTLSILDEYAARYPQFRVHRNEQRLGFNGNFQRALQAAGSEVIAISDQDDVWLPVKIEKCISAWNPASPLIYCDSMSFEGEVPQVPQRSHKHLFFEGKDARRLLFANTVSGHAMMLRRDFLPKVTPFPEGIFYDWWTAFIAADNGGVVLVDEPLVLHRIHASNASGHKEKTAREALIYHRNDTIRHLRIFKDAPDISPQLRAFASRFHTLLTDRNSTAKKWKLVRAIMRHRKEFFYYKHKQGNLASILKYAIRWAFYD